MKVNLNLFFVLTNPNKKNVERDIKK